MCVKIVVYVLEIDCDLKQYNQEMYFNIYATMRFGHHVSKSKCVIGSDRLDRDVCHKQYQNFHRVTS